MEPKEAPQHWLLSGRGRVIIVSGETEAAARAALEASTPFYAHDFSWTLVPTGTGVLLSQGV